MRSSVSMSTSIKDSRGKAFSISSLFPILAIIIGLLVGGIGVLEPSLWELVVGTAIMTILIVLRQDELAATLVIAVRIYFDFYLGLEYVGLVMTLLLLLIFFVARSPQYPWTEPRALWLWGVFLVLAIIPTTHGITLLDSIYYYLNILVTPLALFWLGAILGGNTAHLRRFFKWLAGFGTLMAIHTLIQATTGVFLLSSSRFDGYLAQIGGSYSLGGLTSRAGSLLVNPDSNGSFFGLILFIPLALFVENTSLKGKLFYLIQISLMVTALLFTYSTGGFLAASAGLVVFLVLVGQIRYRVLIPAFVFIIALVIVISFPDQVSLQLSHAIAPSESALRIAAWQTGINVVRAFPLTGVGLGRYVYVQRAEPYRVPLQYEPFYHPHNSYIEIAALAGLPLLILFLALLASAFWLALRNWMRADTQTRFLLAGGIAAVVSLSVNSMVLAAWTLLPLTAIGWLIFGFITSPSLAKSLNYEATKVVKEEIPKEACLDKEVHSYG